MKTKKYPLLIATIISCVIVVVSLFILGFFGMKMGTSLGGGSQFEIAFNDESNASEYTKSVKKILSDNGLQVDTVFVEDKLVSGNTNTGLIEKALVIKLSNEDVSADVQNKVKSEISAKIGVLTDNISDIENITASVSNKNVLYLGLAVGIIVIAFFVFAWIRYDIFASLSFLVAYLHNLILFLSLLILTRVELSLFSLVTAVCLTILMSTTLLVVFEKYREQANLHIGDKLTVAERMISVQKQVLKPFSFIVIAVLVFACLLFIVPARSVRLSAIAIIISLVVSLYTLLIIAPAVFVALRESRDARKNAVLSRNDTVNKVIIKKKKAKASK